MSPVPVQENLPPQPETDKGIPMFVLVLLAIVVAFLVWLLWYTVQKSNNQKPIPVTNQESTQNSPQQYTVSTPTPTPTPRPTGPGQYACSAAGDCKDWDAQIQKANCTITFADNQCLDKCGDRAVRCKL